MTFYSQVSGETFALIRSGKRLIEPRLNDDAHKKIRPGDLMIVVHRETKQEFVTKIVGILRFPSFVEMIHQIGHARFGADDTGVLLKELHHYYKTGDEITHGVLGLKLHLMKAGEQ